MRINVKKMSSVIISNFHHVVKFTIVVFNFSSVSLSLEKSLVTPYNISFKRENVVHFWLKTYPGLILLCILAVRKANIRRAKSFAKSIGKRSLAKHHIKYNVISVCMTLLHRCPKITISSQSHLRYCCYCGEKSILLR